MVIESIMTVEKFEENFLPNLSIHPPIIEADPFSHCEWRSIAKGPGDAIAVRLA